MIKNYWRKLFKNQLMAGSFVLFIGASIANFGNYLYHLLMGRMLGPIDYGVLASLISLTYLFNIPMSTLSLVVTKYVSAWRGKKEWGAIAYFYSWLNKKLTIFTLAGFLLLVILAPWLASFLHLDSVSLVLLMITFSLVAIYLTVNTATLQGFLRFGLMSILGVVQVGLKLGIAVLLVYWGWKVLGAVLAILVGTIISYFLSAIFTLRLLKKKESGKINGQQVLKYTLPVFFSTLAFTSLYTTDIVLARHFLPAQEAGFYAALATLGKIIFFATGPIITVMFPMVSEKHAKGKEYLNLLGLSFGLALLICLGLSGVYLLFPRLMVEILFGHQYLSAASYLFLFAVFLSLYSLAFLLTNFYLSIKKVKIVALPVVAAFAQIVLIVFFHRSLSQLVGVSIGVLGLLLAALLVYFFLRYGQNQKTASLSDCSRL